MSAAPASRRRWALLLPLLGGAAWLAFFGDKTPSGTVQPTRTTAVVPTPASPPPRGTPMRRDAAEPVEALRPRAAPDAAPRPAADLFAVAAWRLPPPPPPPAPAVEQPKATPVLPALNYKVLGKKEENDSWEVFLGRDDLTFIARTGETLEGTWRVEKIEPPLMTLLHVASGQQLKMPIGDGR